MIEFSAAGTAPPDPPDRASARRSAPRRPPADTQERILRCIRRHIAGHGEAPTVQQIGQSVGCAAGPRCYRLAELEAKSAIVREPGHTRGIRLT
ncbi:LexA family protein [Streptomyces achromogenes]|uniref:LexA family protein n=1 Tax=Streptomyces achromogenes TaxID=67255 RepID=UPI0036F8C61D